MSSPKSSASSSDDDRPARREQRDRDRLPPRPPLPPPDQIWSHGTRSTKSLSEALDDPSVTAIETDLLMGYHRASSSSTTTSLSSSGGRNGEPSAEEEDPPPSPPPTTTPPPKPGGGPPVPIAAHPPDRVSDLTFRTFWEMSTTAVPAPPPPSDSSSPPGGVDGSGASGEKRRILRKHLKLDFKELEAVSPCLDVANETFRSDRIDRNGRTIYLNADVLPGPGCRNDGLDLDADAFVERCFRCRRGAVAANEEDDDGDGGDDDGGGRRLGYAFSLGFRVDCRSAFGYDENDADEMKSLILRHGLLDRSEGVVLALNARVLSKRLDAFDEFLDEFPSVQLLIWTATGEPPIARTKRDAIRSHYEIREVADRVGFDCQVAPSFVSGLFYETAVRAVSVYWNVEKLVRECAKGRREETKRKIA